MFICTDLKPANCFLTEDWELKIGDFNTSKYVGEGNQAVVRHAAAA
jgi:serine/threonine protein kinase